MAYFSNNSKDYENAISALTKPTYESKYDSTISDLMDQITNRKEFSYDFNADPLYQNYKDQYTKLGNEASMNAVANTSAMTGGFANSYSATAASQANQQYLTQLNSVIPDLYDAAMQKYEMETENLYNQFDMYETEENRQYGQYRDQVSDYYNDLSDLRGGYSTALSKEESDRDYALSQAELALDRDELNSSNAQWQAEMDYQKDRDKVSDDQWNKEYALSYYSAHKSSGSGSGSGSGTTSELENIILNSSRSKYTTDEKAWAQTKKAAENSGNAAQWYMDMYDKGRLNQYDLYWLAQNGVDFSNVK